MKIPHGHYPTFADSPANILISLHLPKTGGSTFSRLLKSSAGRLWFKDYTDRPSQEQYTERKIGNLWEDCQRYDEVFQAARNYPEKVVVIHGHFYATKYNHVFPDAMKAVWLRDPVERVVSQYYFWQRKPDMNNQFCRQMLEQELDLLQFAALPGVSDLQSRYLAAHSIDEFTFVGLTEQYDDGLQVFCNMFDIVMPAKLKTRNVNEQRQGSHYKLASEQRRVLEELNANDLAVYDQAQARFESLSRQYGDLT